MVEIHSRSVLCEKLIRKLQSANYEDALLELMNLLKIVFPGQYIYIESQAKGESDFEEVTTHKRYGANLPFDKKNGRKILGHGGELLNMMLFFNENKLKFAENIEKGNFNARNLELYKIMKGQIERTKANGVEESIIFFFPAPISLDFEESLITSLCGDMLFYIYQEFCCEGLTDIEMFAIYPYLDGKIVLRNIKKREFLSSEVYKDCFNYYVE